MLGDASAASATIGCKGEDVTMVVVAASAAAVHLEIACAMRGSARSATVSTFDVAVRLFLSPGHDFAKGSRVLVVVQMRICHAVRVSLAVTGDSRLSDGCFRVRARHEVPGRHARRTRVSCRA